MQQQQMQYRGGAAGVAGGASGAGSGSNANRPGQKHSS